MPLTITFELSDKDIEHFLRMAHEAQEAVLGAGLGAEGIAKAARDVLHETTDAELPEFISDRLGKLDTLIAMVEDSEWKLSDEDLSRVLKAMAYFAEPADLIPDRIPGIGFLDDAIMVELIIENLEPEISAYTEFCKFRSSEEMRRKNQGLDTHVGRDDWLADRRAVLQSLMRKRRSVRTGSTRILKLW